MYPVLWRLLPGPAWLKALQSLVLAAAVVAFLFLWLFPRVGPLLPFEQNTVDNGLGPVPTVTSLHQHPGSHA